MINKDSIIVDGTKISVGDLLIRQGNDEDKKLFKHIVGHVFYIKQIKIETKPNNEDEHLIIMLLLNPQVNPQENGEKLGRKIISKRYMYSGVLADKIKCGIYAHYPVISDETAYKQKQKT